MSSPVAWSIDRYARLVGNSSSRTDGQWKYYDDSVTPMSLMVTDYDILVLSRGAVVLESFNLAMNGSTLRGLVRTDSLLIAYKCTTSTRRFRLRFKPQNGRSGSQVCQECVNKLSGYFVIKKMSYATATSTNNTPTDNPSTTTPASRTHPSTAVVVVGDDDDNDNIRANTALAASSSCQRKIVMSQSQPPGQTTTEREHETKFPTLTVTERWGDGDINMMLYGDGIGQEVTIGAVAKYVLSEQSLGLAYGHDKDDSLTTATNNNKDGPSAMDDCTLQQLVRLCVLDPGFPAFVSRVERVVVDVTNTM